MTLQEIRRDTFSTEFETTCGHSHFNPKDAEQFNSNFTFYLLMQSYAVTNSI